MSNFSFSNIYKVFVKLSIQNTNAYINLLKYVILIVQHLVHHHGPTHPRTRRSKSQQKNMMKEEKENKRRRVILHPPLEQQDARIGELTHTYGDKDNPEWTRPSPGS